MSPRVVENVREILDQELLVEGEVDLALGPAALDAAVHLLRHDPRTWAPPADGWERLVHAVAYTLRRSPLRRGEALAALRVVLAGRA